MLQTATHQTLWDGHHNDGHSSDDGVDDPLRLRELILQLAVVHKPGHDHGDEGQDGEQEAKVPDVCSHFLQLLLQGGVLRLHRSGSHDATLHKAKAIAHIHESLPVPASSPPNQTRTAPLDFLEVHRSATNQRT